MRIWYFNQHELMKKTMSILGITTNDSLSSEPSKTWIDHIKGKDENALFVLQPAVDSKRSHIQGGSFICPASINKSIHEIYEAQYSSLISFVDINKSLYEDVNRLLREVNLSHSTLYGGIDSYSKDMRNRLVTMK